MTIIKPSQNKTNIRFFAILFVILAIGGGLCVFQYNSLAEMRHELRDLKQQIPQAEAKNVDLKQELYKKIDPVALEKLAVESQLVLERKPVYLGYSQ